MWRLFLPQVLELFMNVKHLVLLQLFELVNLLVVALGCLYLVAGMYQFIGSGTRLSVSSSRTVSIYW